jgi:hypothetical protein
VNLLEGVAHMGMWEAASETGKALGAYLTYIFKDE